MTPAPRPTIKDVDKKAALKNIARECVMWADGNNAPNMDINQWTELLVNNYMGWNGYENACTLQQCDWRICPDTELVEILSGIQPYISQAITNLIKQWVEEYKIEPDMDIDDHIKYRHFEGFINGFDLERGAYLFVPFNEKEKFKRGGGIIVPYEKAQRI